MHTSTTMQIEIVTRGHPLSPHHEFKFYFEGQIFKSLNQYLSSYPGIVTLGTVKAAYTTRIGQDLYAQKALFAANDIQFQYYNPSENVWSPLLDQTFVYLQGQIMYALTDHQVAALVPELTVMGEANRIFPQSSRIAYFHRAYPFCGKDRCVILTNCWLRTQIYGDAYDEELSREINSLAVV